MQPMPGTLRTCCAWAFCPRGISIRVKRAVRDLLRKRSQLVRQRTTQILEHPEPAGPQPESRCARQSHQGWQAPDIDALALLPEQALCGAG